MQELVLTTKADGAESGDLHLAYSQQILNMAGYRVFNPSR